MKAIVIGAGSFIGRYLIEHLLNNEYDVVVIKQQEQCVDSDANIIEEFIDLLEPLSVVKVLNKYRPDWIFNLPTQSSVGYSWSNPAATVDENINSMLNLLDAVRQLDYKPTVVVVGSGEEYGRVSYDRMPIKENEPPKPQNIFAASKVCQAMIAQIYCKAYDMKIIVARAFNEIGPGQSEKFVVSDFARQVALIEKGLQTPIVYTGNINIQRDFTDIRDMVKALVLLAEKGQSGEVYNVGTGKAVKLKEILNILQGLTQKTFEIKAQEKRIRPIDVFKLEADVSKICKDTGWKSEMLIEITVSNILQFWRDSI